METWAGGIHSTWTNENYVHGRGTKDLETETFTNTHRFDAQSQRQGIILVMLNSSALDIMTHLKTLAILPWFRTGHIILIYMQMPPIS